VRGGRGTHCRIAVHLTSFFFSLNQCSHLHGRGERKKKKESSGEGEGGKHATFLAVVDVFPDGQHHVTGEKEEKGGEIVKKGEGRGGGKGMEILIAQHYHQFSIFLHPTPNHKPCPRLSINVKK